MRQFVSPGVRRLVVFVLSGLVASANLAASAVSAKAETKTFFVENQPDGYGIDQCLATGAMCGKPMASLYCQSRQYGEVVSFRKAGPEEMSKDTGEAACSAGGCVNFVAIECQR
jgi:hypothetical protein